MKTNSIRGVIQLSQSETKVWEDGGPGGYEFRRAINAKAAEMARKSGKPVEVYASKSEGGWCANQILPE